MECEPAKVIIKFKYVMNDLYLLFRMKMISKTH